VCPGSQFLKPCCTARHCRSVVSHRRGGIRDSSPVVGNPGAGVFRRDGAAAGPCSLPGAHTVLQFVFTSKDSDAAIPSRGALCCSCYHYRRRPIFSGAAQAKPVSSRVFRRPSAAISFHNVTNLSVPERCSASPLHLPLRLAPRHAVSPSAIHVSPPDRLQRAGMRQKTTWKQGVTCCRSCPRRPQAGSSGALPSGAMRAPAARTWTSNVAPVLSPHSSAKILLAQL